jgi:hypothetical protein
VAVVISGVYRTRNDGATWDWITGDLPAGPRCTFLDDHDRLYVGTLDRGIYRTIDPLTDVPEDAGGAAASEESLTCFPVPTNGSAQFQVRLGATAHISLAIYDVLGRCVATIDDGVRPPGDHVVRWEADAPSGVYLARLQIGSGRDADPVRWLTKKFLLVR